MDLKALFAKHSVESAELLADIQSSLDSSDMIPNSRFKQVIKERNELRADMAEKDSNIETLKAEKELLATDINGLTKIKTMWEGEETKRTAKIKTDWEDKSKIFDIENTDKRFDKVSEMKDSFVFAAEGEELTPEQMKANVEKYTLLEKTGVFGVSKDSVDYDKGKVITEVKSRFKGKNPYVNMMKKK